jgi:hypothetical protein
LYCLKVRSATHNISIQSSAKIVSLERELDHCTMFNMSDREDLCHCNRCIIFETASSFQAHFKRSMVEVFDFAASGVTRASSSDNVRTAAVNGYNQLIKLDQSCTAP